MRRPAVAGQFYKGTSEALVRQIEDCYRHDLGPGTLPTTEHEEPLTGLVSPHAGFMFSGPVAAHGFARLGAGGLKGKTAIVIGPNHTGIGKPIAVCADEYSTPFGPVRTDEDVVQRLVSQGICEDGVAHTYEHSVEVQVPFLQHLTDDFRIVPIVMMSQDLQNARRLGKALGSLPQDDLVYIASTDFSHYVPQEVARAADSLAIERILAMDPVGLLRTVTEKRISMCGFGPVMAMLMAVGDGEARLLKYCSSGDIMSMREVVGYASILVRGG